MNSTLGPYLTGAPPSQKFFFWTHSPNGLFLLLYFQGALPSPFCPNEGSLPAWTLKRRPPAAGLCHKPCAMLYFLSVSAVFIPQACSPRVFSSKPLFSSELPSVEESLSLSCGQTINRPQLPRHVMRPPHLFPPDPLSRLVPPCWSERHTAKEEHAVNHSHSNPTNRLRLRRGFRRSRGGVGAVAIGVTTHLNPPPSKHL